MHLRKRPRPPPGSPMRRSTSSMALLAEEEGQSQQDPINGVLVGSEQRPVHSVAVFRPFMSLSPFAQFLAPQTDYFLQACSLCKLRLGPGKDIYMYRGDAAFCSAECRNEQIVVDERMEKCAVVMRKKESPSANRHRSQSAAGANPSTLTAA
ncbi:hypothetical protein KI387_039480 [Taxus chinensis]|uniref:FLZ-type domain-containing protein n=1 Tax=Taxus chinensis TaxID=29808 RepID=A0AA38C8K8_TAXCH|nr:hypothetical protein KI387_039480 [Taxus chinensis]